MKITTDLHMHSTFSSDGRASIHEMGTQAAALGLSHIALTEHAEWVPRARPFNRIDSYFYALKTANEQLQTNGLTLLSGVELGNPHWFPNEANQLLASHNFDVILGSVHWMYDTINIHSSPVFKGRETRAVFADYFAETEKMAATSPINVVAHIDRLWQCATMLGLYCHPREIESEVRAALDAIIANDIFLELNTKHVSRADYWRIEIATIYRWYAEMGGRYIVVNSDSHAPSEIGRNFDLTINLLEDIGLAEMILPADYFQSSSNLITAV